MTYNSMQIIQKENKKIYQIPLNLNDLLESQRIDLPSKIILETCESTFVDTESTVHNDGEIVIMNFLEGGVSLRGNITGTRDQEHGKVKFALNPKENTTIFGWQYSNENEINLSVNIKLLTGQEIRVLKDEIIPINTRFKQLLFYS